MQMTSYRRWRDRYVDIRRSYRKEVNRLINNLEACGCVVNNKPFWNTGLVAEDNQLIEQMVYFRSLKSQDWETTA